MSLVALGMCIAVLVPLYSSFTLPGHGISEWMQDASFFAVIIGIVVALFGITIIAGIDIELRG